MYLIGFDRGSACRLFSHSTVQLYINRIVYVNTLLQIMFIILNICFNMANKPTEAKTMKLDQIRKALNDRRLIVVAAATRISYGTILAIRDNPEANPSVKTLKIIEDYLKSTRV